MRISEYQVPRVSPTRWVSIVSDTQNQNQPKFQSSQIGVESLFIFLSIIDWLIFILATNRRRRLAGADEIAPSMVWNCQTQALVDLIRTISKRARYLTGMGLIKILERGFGQLFHWYGVTLVLERGFGELLQWEVFWTWWKLTSNKFWLLFFTANTGLFYYV